ncbi:hypothetical protein J2129_000344 [Methanofollis sp. W23]|nr:hypothetical protein [Methanofollis sp. W23]
MLSHDPPWCGLFQSPLNKEFGFLEPLITKIDRDRIDRSIRSPPSPVHTRLFPSPGPAAPLIPPAVPTSSFPLGPQGTPPCIVICCGEADSVTTVPVR